jgi:hypothetical protein
MVSLILAEKNDGEPHSGGEECSEPSRVTVVSNMERQFDRAVGNLRGPRKRKNRVVHNIEL